MTAPAEAQQDTMSFFVTSVGKGNGADLGGLASADAHCQALAQAAGSTKTNWHAYLSTTEPGGAAGAIKPSPVSATTAKRGILIVGVTKILPLFRC